MLIPQSFLIDAYKATLGLNFVIPVYRGTKTCWRWYVCHLWRAPYAWREVRVMKFGASGKPVFTVSVSLDKASPYSYSTMPCIPLISDIP